MKKTIKMFLKIRNFYLLCLACPAVVFADITASPWAGVGGVAAGKTIQQQSFGVIAKALIYGATAIGGLMFIGAAIHLWNIVNMSKEEKNKHNIPVDVLVTIAVLVIGIMIVGLAITGLASSE